MYNSAFVFSGIRVVVYIAFLVMVASGMHLQPRRKASSHAPTRLPTVEVVNPKHSWQHHVQREYWARRSVKSHVDPARTLMDGLLVYMDGIPGVHGGTAWK